MLSDGEQLCEYCAGDVFAGAEQLGGRVPPHRPRVTLLAPEDDDGYLRGDALPPSLRGRPRQLLSKLRAGDAGASREASTAADALPSPASPA